MFVYFHGTIISDESTNLDVWKDIGPCQQEKRATPSDFSCACLGNKITRISHGCLFFFVFVCDVTTGVNSSAAATGTFAVVFLDKLDR